MLLLTITTYAQGVEVNEQKNGITRISTKEYTIEFDNFFDLNIEKFISGNSTQYYIRGASEANEYHNFPPKAKMMLNLMNGNTIELTAIYTELVELREGHEWKPMAYYPISEEQLHELFTGVKKITVEMLSYNKKTDKVFTDMADIEFKKDKIGKELKAMYDNINK